MTKGSNPFDVPWLGSMLGLALLCASAAAAAEMPATPRLDHAREVAWETAGIIMEERLARLDLSESPALHAFLKELIVRAARVSPDSPPRDWPALGIAEQPLQSLFWLANYDVDSADPVWLLLHGSLLLADGEAHRALHVLALGRHARNAKGGWRDIREELIGLAFAGILEGIEYARVGVELAAAGRFQAANTQLRLALLAWPQNATAHHELSRSMTQQLLNRLVSEGDAAQTAPTGLSESRELRPFTHAEVTESLARCRSHDPHFWTAWQGTDEAMFTSALLLQEKILPLWDRIATDPARILSAKELEGLALAYRDAGIHEMALVTRSILRARRGPHGSDVELIGSSLLALVPGDAAKPTLARLTRGGALTVSLVAPRE